MADFAYVPCPQCKQQFMVGLELFGIPDAYCVCPFCHHEFTVGVAAGQTPAPGRPVPGSA